MSEDNGQDKPRGLTRRELLGKVAKAGLGLAAGAVAGGPLVAGLQKLPEKAKSQSFQPVAPPASVSVSTTPAVSDITPEETLTPLSKKPETPKEQISFKRELFFISERDKETTRDGQEKVGAQISHYKEVEKDLTGRITRTLKYKDMVMTVAGKLGFKKDSPVPELLLGLIFVESGGNPDAIADKPDRKSGEKIEGKDKNKARGLCQVKPDTAKETARKSGLQINTDSLFDPETSITLALEYLDRLYTKLFPDLGIAFWAYHLGEGNMALAIETHLTEDIKIPKTPVSDVLLNKETPGTFKLIRDYNITFSKLVNSGKVREKLKAKDAFNDDTEAYVPRIAAAMQFLGL